MILGDLTNKMSNLTPILSSIVKSDMTDSACPMPIVNMSLFLVNVNISHLNEFFSLTVAGTCNLGVVCSSPVMCKAIKVFSSGMVDL